ncbi:MAG TPA: sensor domain-containing diguanylate cyclase [Mycobacteriales bacterium]|jgi:diguanylate cyclase (GGDEF)-like protein/PAS domain S-box-containing protein|nr:sensor domain-containing diguanylate cyclase [Mycobacteriales bacterium]
MVQRTTLAARQLALLFAAAGLLSFVAIGERGSEPLEFAGIGAAALAAAAVTMLLPWTRWPNQVALLLLVPAFVLIGLAQGTHLLPARTFGSLFVLLFAWIGAHERPRTALVVLPFAAVAYVIPVLAAPHDAPFSIPGFVATMSVCVLIAETMSRALAATAESQRDVARSALTMRLILESSPQPTVALDMAGLVTTANPAAAAALGFADAEDLIGLELHDVMHHTKRDGTPYRSTECPLYTALSAGEPAYLEAEMFFRRDGRAFFADFSLQPVRHGDATVGAVSTFTDVTQRRQAERETRARLVDSQRAALTDPLTGVGNRRQADAFLAAVVPGDAVVLVDVDHFKRVNDDQGHVAGDEVLRRLAGLLVQQVRADDHVARFGGEEFVVVLTGGASTAVTAVERIARAWAEISEGVTFSAGVAAHTAGGTVIETLAAADRALYEAKAQGRDRVVAASPGEPVRA